MSSALNIAIFQLCIRGTDSRRTCHMELKKIWTCGKIFCYCVNVFLKKLLLGALNWLFLSAKTFLITCSALLCLWQISRYEKNYKKNRLHTQYECICSGFATTLGAVCVSHHLQMTSFRAVVTFRHKWVSLHNASKNIHCHCAGNTLWNCKMAMTTISLQA